MQYNIDRMSFMSSMNSMNHLNNMKLVWIVAIALAVAALFAAIAFVIVLSIRLHQVSEDCHGSKKSTVVLRTPWTPLDHIGFTCANTDEDVSHIMRKVQLVLNDLQIASCAQLRDKMKSYRDTIMDRIRSNMGEKIRCADITILADGAFDVFKQQLDIPLSDKSNLKADLLALVRAILELTCDADGYLDLHRLDALLGRVFDSLCDPTCVDPR